MLRTMMLLALAGLLSLQCPAQNNGNTSDKQAAQTAESIPKKFYQLNFVVRELENEHVINSRSYSMSRRADTERTSIRTGEKVPYSYSSTSGSSTPWQQINVGVNLDCDKLEEIGDQVALTILAEISSVVDTNGEASAPLSMPVIRTNRWQSTVPLHLNQQTVLFSADDPASKRKMQLLLTVTPIRLEH